ncbi:hypothetical protein [Kineosporia sp. R_H_3]|uniref:hypothetical protein n=1 Tax=Kineosporia sp. R_H_3 TaxID=1961848 RepID=UPI000B4A56F1|nr:hypothetical protein [Kineosporia sp. R_H_3]MBI4942488.1 hypothetical protein [Actinomycetota bacterium]
MGQRWAPPVALIATAWDDVQERVAAITASVPGGADLDGLDVPARYTLGVFFAARWTVGLAGHRPLTGIDSTVTDDALRAELAVAEYLVVTQAPTWDLAAGVRAWIGWLVGAVDDLTYPQPRG